MKAGVVIALINCCAKATSAFTGSFLPISDGGRRAVSHMHSTTALPLHQVSIEYCKGCRWGLRASWMAQELLTTFADDNGLEAVTLIPSKEAGRFLVTCSSSSFGSENKTTKLLWERTAAVGFPEMKTMKQLVRDEIDPERFLGHSDSAYRKEAASPETASEAESAEAWASEGSAEAPLIRCAVSPHVSILYCTGCRWMFRAAYFAQELLSTFADEIQSVSLVPSRPPAPGGSFAVQVENVILWDRSEEGRFPETKELKQLIRDRLSPLKDLGHSDSDDTPDEDEMDDDEAEEARNFFGVM